jgi:YgiT-type zinc finger domain-containing protein
MEERSKNKKAMKCCFCGGDMAKGKTTYTVNRRGYHLLIDDVPAWKCTQCGEAYFEESEVEAIQEMLRKVDAGAAKVRKEVARPVTA